MPSNSQDKLQICVKSILKQKIVQKSQQSRKAKKHRENKHRWKQGKGKKGAQVIPAKSLGKEQDLQGPSTHH